MKWIAKVVALSSVFWMAGCARPVIDKGFQPCQTSFQECTNTQYVSDKDAVAVVLGKNLGANNPEVIRDHILSVLLDNFAKEQKIEASQDELNAFVKTMDTSMMQDQSEGSTESELVQDKQMHDAMILLAPQWVMKWKINKALYKMYGGRVAFQQAGPEPLDSYRLFLTEQEEKGAFRIFDEEFKKDFWEYFTNDDMHQFYPKEDGEAAINTPWWLMEKPIDE